MDINELKYVVGQAVESQPAYMRFYGTVNAENSHRFNEEFLYLTDYVKPSKIIIGINSEGGSVLHGMGTFSLIQNSPIETETVIEGLAASMGSILWAAGTRSYMRDYSILMIHNPFLSNGNEDLTPDQQQTVSAFRQQLEVIYHRRFGLAKSKVKEIMDGAEGCDGTYFDAKSAVEAGILPKENIIKTPKQVSTKVKSQIEGVTEIASLQAIMASAEKEMENFKPLPEPQAILKQNQNEKLDTMNEQENVFAFSSVCAQLGLEKDSEMSVVVSRLTELQNTENKLKDLQNSFDALKIAKEGSDAQLTNVQNELTQVKDELKVYKDAEEAKRNSDIEALVDAAIADGKISADAKDKWVAMAHTNLEMVEATLESIQAREKISEKIANDAENINKAEASLTDAEKLMAQKVEEAVGKDFKFKTMVED